MKNRIELDGIWKYKADPAGTVLFHSLVETFPGRTWRYRRTGIRRDWRTPAGWCGSARFKVPSELAGQQLVLTFTGSIPRYRLVNHGKAGEHQGYFRP